MSKVTRIIIGGKPAKPRPDFPLFAHSAGVWAKKVRGRFVYFGPWDDPEGALKKWLDQKDDLLAGRTPRASRDGLTVANLCNEFQNAKRLMAESGELADRTLATYYATCDRVVRTFGKDRFVDDLAADDFRHLRSVLAKRYGAVALGNEIQRVRCIFKFGHDEGLIEKAIRYGQAFDKPSKQVLRRTKTASGLRLFERDELLKVLDAATINLRAMVLLGINAAMGNTDLALMPTKAANLKTGWLDYPRQKTDIPRRIPLWLETIAAIKDVIAHRHEPKDTQDVKLLFIGPRGENYIGEHKGYRVAAEMTRALAKAKVNRPGLNFYALRHTFQTIAEGSRDLSAVQAIMGHASGNADMSAVYRERVEDERLKTVVKHVRKWLWPEVPVETEKK